MKADVTLHIDAEPLHVWELVSDITKMGTYSPEVFAAEWLGGATGPAVGVRYRGHGGFLRERRNERDMLRTLERVKEAAEAARA